ncbi:hypothetical protein [Spirosoma radiotolerans]|uniref:Lipoprotein n=1 Tax=Spirosoma radiotolerans TaxID=1379870 RepID=A0A0E3V7B2_9BACT|nr:hypothetical protein [Spirosoma radiotolerans]AKD55271.1 hypothetical protein SD10_10535 [Spirosoma radiotolerans]
MKPLKKYALLALTLLTVGSSLTSCATVFGGRITDGQKRRPMPGETQRQVRAGALIADILLFPLISIPVDFATGAIYKPRQAAPVTSVATQQPTKK